MHIEIESAPKKMQTAMSSTYIIGYRLGMIVAGAGSILIASYFGVENDVYNPLSWQIAYVIMGVIQVVGLITCLTSSEPNAKRTLITSTKDKIRLLLIFFISLFIFFLSFSFFPGYDFVDPFIKGLWGSLKFAFAFSNSIICFLIAIKLNLIEVSIIRSTFWNPINDFLKTHGKLAISILIIIGIYRVADIVMGVMANLFYSDMGYSLKQIATFSKLWGLFAIILGGCSGGVVDSIGYENFFIFTAALGIPVFILIFLLKDFVLTIK